MQPDYSRDVLLELFRTPPEPMPGQLHARTLELRYRSSRIEPNLFDRIFLFLLRNATWALALFAGGSPRELFTPRLDVEQFPSDYADDTRDERRYRDEMIDLVTTANQRDSQRRKRLEKTSEAGLRPEPAFGLDQWIPSNSERH
ncbi:MAG TPA: hypothetical protein VIL97_05080 [Thermoanaerobaculia bacterium]